MALYKSFLFAIQITSPLWKAKILHSRSLFIDFESTPFFDNLCENLKNSLLFYYFISLSLFILKFSTRQICLHHCTLFSPVIQTVKDLKKMNCSNKIRNRNATKTYQRYVSYRCGKNEKQMQRSVVESCFWDFL